MTGPHPAVAAVRNAVRASLGGLPPGAVVLAACSGGADSLALAAALAFEAPRAGLVAGGVSVDHRLQPGSAQRAAQVAAIMGGLGLSPALAVTAEVAARGERDGYGGPEAAARKGRYAALDEAADAAGAAAILVGHTLDDQAETVLLGLARGSGARSLAGMAPVAGRYRRPLLGLRRDTTRQACEAQALSVWDDPHNADPAFTRSRVRRQLLPALAGALGPGIPEALARTAELLRADADALDGIAAQQAIALGGAAAAAGPGWPAEELAALAPAIRRRVLRLGAVAAGCPAGTLTRGHITSLDELITDWHGQRWADLPGGLRGERRCGRLAITHQQPPGPAVPAGHDAPAGAGQAEDTDGRG